MADRLQELREKREKVITDQRALIDTAEKESRNMTDDENAKWESMDKDFEKYDTEIRREEAAAAEKITRLADLEAREAKLAERKSANLPSPEKDESRESADAKSEEVFKRFLADGERGVTLDEMRALQADSDTKGGFIVAPEQFMNELIKDLEDQVFVRRNSKVIGLTKAASLTVPELVRQDDPTWTAEIDTGADDSGMGFQKRQLTPHPLAKAILISKTLLRLSTLNVEGEVRSDMSYKFATTEENAFLNGTGQNEPLGVFVASNFGITTARDISAGNTTTAIKADNLIECAYALKAQYRGTSRWLFHRDALKMIRKLKDGNGDYIWNSGIATNRPATIVDQPYDESEYAPNTFTSGSYIGLLANWRYYWIVDALNMQLQVLTELYARTNQNGYIGRKETDGMPVHEDGFVRVTLG